MELASKAAFNALKNKRIFLKNGKGRGGLALLGNKIVANPAGIPEKIVRRQGRPCQD